MRLFEAIIDANHRALAGDESAGLRPADFADSLPIVALTCIDPRLNPLMPEVLGIPEESFIWLRNAGNVVTGPISSTMRSLALACAIKGGREIVVIGHTDCQVRKTSVMELTSRFQSLGIDRARLPENLNEYFGLFASERQNVLRGVEHVRSSPIIGPAIPVHGLLVEIDSGRLEWLVNGYQTLGTGAMPAGPSAALSTAPLMSALEMAPFAAEEWKAPVEAIGEVSGKVQEWVTKLRIVEGEAAAPPPPPKLPARPIPIPPPIRPGDRPRPGSKGRR